MGKIDELIQQYCPEGVEYVPIWSLTAWDKKFNGVEKSKQTKVIKYNYLLAADLKSYQVENGTVKLLTTNISNLYTTEELSDGLASDGEVVAIPWGGNPIVQYYKGRFLTADNRIATSLDTNILNNKFLYYCMLSQMKLIASFYRGSGIKHPEMSKVLDLEIPLPPLPVQEAIVNILDRFAVYTAELQAELQARQQQYNYYRDTLLSFEGRDDVQWKKLGEVCKVLRGKRLTKSQLSSDGMYKVFHGGIEPIGFFDQSNREGDTTMVINVGASAGTVGFSKEAFWSSDGCFCLSHTPILSGRFLYYYLQTKEPILMSRVRKAGIPTLDGKVLEDIPIPIIPIIEQERIISILNRFDTLVNDLSQGLPAEIEARQQQYEYYRDQLLTFKRKEA